MRFQQVGYTGPPIDDERLRRQLPPALSGLLVQVNGFIQFDGGFHLRGICAEPGWHSLADAWTGGAAFHRLYPELTPEDIPFGEDCVGDQFFLRDEIVHRLSCETGEVESLDLSFHEFLAAANDDPVNVLSLHPLVQFQEEGGQLKPGQLLSVYPPFCTEQAQDGVSLAAVPTDERRRFLADFARQIRDIPDGDTIQTRIDD